MPSYYSQFNFNNVPLKNVVIERGTTAPASPAVDQLWVDTNGTPHLLKMYDGSAWVAIGYIADGSITDAKIAANAAIALSKLATNPLARANHTGTQAASTISDLAAVVKAYSLSEFAALTADLDVNGNKVTNLAAPDDPTDAVTKEYADNLRAGISLKDPVEVVASGNVNLAAPGATIDGVTLDVGERFLAPLQTDPAERGIYVFQGAATAATRETGDIVDGTLVAVAAGTKAGEQWMQTADVAGGANEAWTAWKLGGQTYTAGTGLSLAGTQFSLPNVTIANGGTGATTAAGARTNLDAAGAYGVTVDAGDLPGSGTAALVVHGLNTIYVGVFTTLDSTGERVDLDWRVVDANTVEISSEVALPGDVNVAVFGA